MQSFRQKMARGLRGLRVSSGMKSPTTPPKVILPQWHWHQQALLKLREQIGQSRAEHNRAAIAPMELGGIDAADFVQQEQDRTVLWAELGGEADELAEIDAALDRINKGTYGKCEATGAMIDPKRLRALPWTRFSRGAAEQIQRNRPANPGGQTRHLVSRPGEADENA